MCFIDKAAGELFIIRVQAQGVSMKRVLLAVLMACAGCGESDSAKHSAVALRVLTQRGSPDFIDASTEDYAAIRHTPSGMLCVMPADGAFEFDVFPASAANRGAHCSSTSGEVANAWVTMNFRQPTTLDAAFATAVAEISGQAESRVWDGEPSVADRSSPEGLSHYRIHRFIVTYGDSPRYMRLAMSEMDGWYLQQIVSSPVQDAEAAEQRAGEEWRFVLRAFVAQRAAAQPAQ